MDETRTSRRDSDTHRGGRETKRGVNYFHLGDDPVALPVAELYGKGALRAASSAGRASGKGTWLASWAPIPRNGRNGPGAPGWRDVPWFRSRSLFVSGPCRVLSQVASFGGSDGCSIIVGEDSTWTARPRSRRRLDWACDGTAGSRSASSSSSPSDNSCRAEYFGEHGSTQRRPDVSTPGRWCGLASTLRRLAKGPVPRIVSWSPFYHIGGLGPLFEVVTPVDWHILPMGRFVRDPQNGSDWSARTVRFPPTGRPRRGGGLAGLSQAVGGRRPVVLERGRLQCEDASTPTWPSASPRCACRSHAARRSTLHYACLRAA